ncbi:C4H2-type domain-containing protein [Aphelenchoides bicaudatus]|nr:C4H2-type domain-containing protein [Aphelenchoides bicaudatus]
MTSNDFEAISTELCQIAQIHDYINQVRQLAAQFQLELNSQQECAEFLYRCEQAANRLSSEHKTHTEELRLINQDINHLEDLVKSHKNAYSDQKTELAKKYHHFRRNLFCLNSDISELNLPNQSLQIENLVDVPQWLSETTNQVGASPTSSLANPLLNFSRLFGSNPQLVNHLSKLFPPNSTFAGRPYHQEDPSKLKNCQFCSKEIHRNAPVCPYCKQKSSSLRNPRRLKKKNS